jgi:hypothetical protein
LFQALLQNASLRVINLEGNILADDCAKYIAQALQVPFNPTILIFPPENLT